MPRSINKKYLNPAVNSKIRPPKNFPIHSLWWVIFVRTNYAQLLLYIFYKQSDLYMLVTTNALLVTTTGEHGLVGRGYTM